MEEQVSSLVREEEMTVFQSIERSLLHKEETLQISNGYIFGTFS